MKLQPNRNSCVTHFWGTTQLQWTLVYKQHYKQDYFRVIYRGQDTVHDGVMSKKLNSTLCQGFQVIFSHPKLSAPPPWPNGSAPAVITTHMGRRFAIQSLRHETWLTATVPRQLRKSAAPDFRQTPNSNQRNSLSAGIFAPTLVPSATVGPYGVTLKKRIASTVFSNQQSLESSRFTI